MRTAQTRRRGPGSRAGIGHPTRHELVEAAEVIAHHDGLASLSVESVTRAAGLAKGTFYVHFSDRSDLLVEVHRRFHDQLFERIRRQTQGIGPGPERVRVRLIAYLDGCRMQQGVRSMLIQARSMPELAEQVQRRNEEAAQELAVDLVGVTAWPRETARLVVAAAAEAALAELQAGRRLPRIRKALLALVSD